MVGKFLHYQHQAVCVQEIHEKERLVYTLSKSFRSKGEIISWRSSQGDSFHLAWQLEQLGRPDTSQCFINLMMLKLKFVVIWILISIIHTGSSQNAHKSHMLNNLNPKLILPIFMTACVALAWSSRIQNQDSAACVSGFLM